jgi:hypothetical protein
MRNETPAIGLGVVAGAVAQDASATLASALANRRRVMDRNMGALPLAASGERHGLKLSECRPDGKRDDRAGRVR